MSEDEEKEALERFLLDNPELDSIEAALDQFKGMVESLEGNQKDDG